MANVELQGWDELTQQLNRVDDQLTKRTTREAVKAGGEVIARRAKQLCPRGNPADKPDLKPLAETIAVEVRDYDVRALAVVGPQMPAGAHGHNVENGHEEVLFGVATGRRVPPKPFVRPAFDSTQAEQLGAMQAVVDRTLQDFGAV